MNSSNAQFTLQDFHSGEEYTLNATSLRALFERDGVLVFPRFFSAELPEVKTELRKYFAPIQAKADASAAVSTIANQHGCDVIPWNPIEYNNPVFIGLRDHSDFIEATKAVLGEGFGAPGSLVMFSVGGGHGQAWHQDCPAGDDKGFNLNRLIYTEDISLEDGAIVFVPGSHKQGRIPIGGHQETMQGEIVFTPCAGTLLFLHGHVFHRVTPNLNKNPRTSVNFRAYPLGVDPDVNCIGVYRNAEVNFCDKPKHHDGRPAQ